MAVVRVLLVDDQAPFLLAMTFVVQETLGFEVVGEVCSGEESILSVAELRTIGIEPDIRVVVESFLALPFLVADTDRVAMVQGRLASRLGEAAGVRVFPCPWEVVILVEAFWWPPAMHGDPAHSWPRAALKDASARLNEHVP